MKQSDFIEMQNKAKQYEELQNKINSIQNVFDHITRFSIPEYNNVEKSIIITSHCGNGNEKFDIPISFLLNDEISQKILEFLKTEQDKYNQQQEAL